MWGMFGLVPDLDLEEEAGEKVSLDSDDNVQVGDIVTVATRALKPVLETSENYDDKAELRVVGEAQGDRKVYLCLVTDGDAVHINPTVIIGNGQAFDYGHDPRFNGCDGIILSEFHVRGIAKKQRGRSCVKCTEYNKDVRIPKEEAYYCRTCRENPWR